MDGGGKTAKKILNVSWTFNLRNLETNIFILSVDGASTKSWDGILKMNHPAFTPE